MKVKPKLKTFRNTDPEEVVSTDSAEKVCRNAFAHCKNLKRIITPEGTESKYKEQILKTIHIVVVFY